MKINESKQADVLKNLRHRSIIRRLWESYAFDLIAILELASKGHLDQCHAQNAISELVPAMKMLRDGGDFQKKNSTRPMWSFSRKYSTIFLKMIRTRQTRWI